MVLPKRQKRGPEQEQDEEMEKQTGGEGGGRGREEKPEEEKTPPTGGKNSCQDIKFISSILANTAGDMSIPFNSDSVKSMPKLKSHYFGTHFFSEIQGNGVDEHHYLHIKVATEDPKERRLSMVKNHFHNDVYFYMYIDFALKNYWQKETVKQIKREIAKGYVRENDPDGKYDYDSVGTLRYHRLDGPPEIIVMDGLYEKDFKPAEYNLFTEKQMFTALRELAKFHALSMAFRVARPKEFDQFLKDRRPTLLYPEFSPVVIHEVVDSLNEWCNIIRVRGWNVSKLKAFVKHSETYFREVINYSGEFTCLVHMDCSFNKFLFNLENDKMKVNDFFHWCPGTPIYDISYMFFTRGYYHQFSFVIRPYLEMYYEMFLEFSLRFGINPLATYSFEEMTREFEKYHRFGLFMAIHYFVKKIQNTKKGMDDPETQDMAKVRLFSIYRWLQGIRYFERELIVHPA